jgi:glycosyltransferase involved in cell wall biosynthesis
LRLQSPRLEVVHNAVEVSRFSVGAPPFARRGQDVVMAARFARQKDQATLIRAVQHLVATGWTGKVVLAGDGKASHRRACESLARRLGLGDRVDFPGRVGDTAALFHRCRAAVLSTHYEGLPLSLVEYMAAGCAAIASRAPGVDDVIQHGQNGWLFPTGDDAALADILRRVLAGGDEIEAVVARGQAEAPARFATDLMLSRYETLFSELLNSSQAPY